MRLFALLTMGLLAQPAFADALTTFPSEILRACRGGSAKIYDECSDQRTLFHEALSEARRTDKVLLVSYGAEWCIWCHVFNAYVTGTSGMFAHTYSDQDDVTRDTAVMFETPSAEMEKEARALEAFVADNFVMLHLEYRYSTGADAVVAATGFDPDQIRWLPFIFTVSQDGAFAMELDHDLVEERREGVFWFRGYRRGALLAELTKLRDAALRR